MYSGSHPALFFVGPFSSGRPEVEKEQGQGGTRPGLNMKRGRALAPWFIISPGLVVVGSAGFWRLLGGRPSLAVSQLAGRLVRAL